MSQEIPFSLRYHCALTGAAGSLGMPLWSGVEPGKWSMDYDAAVAWSASNEKPFLLYFAGTAWCPSCVSFEHLVVSSAGFQTAIGDMPMVLLDNRRRGEVTGPTLLYAPDYQTYIQSADATADVEAKLRSNKQLQDAYQEPGKSKVNYPSLLLCQSQADGSVRVVSRVDMESAYPIGVTNSPVGTDFSALGATTVAKLLAMLDDPYEEDDNWAQNSELAATITIPAPEDALRSESASSGTVSAVIGGYDTVDWRAVEFTEKYSCLFRLEGDFDDNASVTLGIYDTLGTGAKDGNLKQQVTGTGAELPQLEFRAAGPSGYRLKVQVEGQTAPVEYSVVATAADLPPYDIGLDATVYHVRRVSGTGRTAMVELKAPWKRMEETELTGEVALDVAEGQCDSLLTFGNGGQDASGTLSLEITALPLPSKDSVVPKEVKVALGSVANCRVTKNAEAVIRIYALPAFGTYASGDTMTLKLSQDMDLPANGIAIPFVNGLTDDTEFVIVSGTLPAGLNLAIQNEEGKPGFGKLVLTGKPTEAITKAQMVTVQLKTSDGEAGATLKFAFTVAPLSEVNPVADTTKAYTGYIVSSENGVVFGTFTLDRQTDRSLKVTASFIDMEPVTRIAPAWTALATGDVYTELDLDGELLVLMVLTDGTGFGWFEDSELENCYLSFMPNMPAATAKAEYAGFYNVAFESTHPDYQGFGWMTLDINTSGRVKAQGVTPDGMSFANTTNLVEEKGVGVFTIVTYNPDGQDYASGRIQITPRSAREDGVACVSACDSAMGIFWYDLASNVISRLTPCGTEYDTSAEQTFTNQIQLGGGEYENLYFYAISMPKAEDVPASYPAGICPQLLPAVEIVEGNRSFEINESAYEGLNGAPFEGLDFQLKFTNQGKMSGSFQAFDLATAAARKLKFEGILTPIPASCCGGGDTYALGYGSIFSAEEAKSWPVRISPPTPPPYPVDELITGAPVVEEITAKNLTVSGVEEINRKLSAYVLLDDEGVPRAFAVANPDTGEGVIDWADLALPAGSQVAVVVNGLISAGTEVLKIEVGDFEISLNNDDKFEEDDPEDAVKGWRIYSMPTTYMLAEPVPVDENLTIYAYPGNGKNPVRLEDWSELLPGQAFWVYVDKKSLGTAPTLVSVQGVSVFNMKVQGIEPVPGQFVFSVAPAEMDGAEFWKWTGEFFQKDTDGAGWLRLPKIERKR